MRKGKPSCSVDPHFFKLFGELSSAMENKFECGNNTFTGKGLLGFRQMTKGGGRACISLVVIA